MKGSHTKQAADRRVVKLAKGLLNRYYDDNKAPRQESYAEDIHTAEAYSGSDGMVFTHLRAAAESGWDFSSRWFADTAHLATIETATIIPVDLNALLYKTELIISEAAKALKQTAKAKHYAQAAKRRRKALLRYCWDEAAGFFFDYDFRQRRRTGKWSLAALMPLFVKAATPLQAEDVMKAVQQQFLKDGGAITTLYHTGQQWDAPNGWAPLQFITVQGLLNYGFTDLAKTIAQRWMAVNENVFNATGKMLEKYNVENVSLESGGGEYPTQDGFGWTNGVYLKFWEMFGK